MNDSDSFFGSGRKISFLKRKTEDGSAILLGKLQDLLECLFFSRIDGIDQRAAGIYLKGSFYDDRIRAVVSMAAAGSTPGTPIFTSRMSAPAATSASPSFLMETKLPF